MKRLLSIFPFLLIYFFVSAQVYTKPGGYGTQPSRLAVDSTFSFPTGCGAPFGTASLKSTLTKKAAKYFDSCNNKEYTFNPKDSTWRETGSMSAIQWDSVKNKPANFPTTYALSNDVKDSILTTFRTRDTANAFNNFYNKTATDGKFMLKQNNFLINVKDYGATGDGETNDYISINNAISAASSANGGTVFFPTGSYNISTSSLIVPANVILKGLGRRSTTILYSGTDYALKLGGTASSLYYGLGVEEIGIVLSNISGNGIALYGTSGAYVQDVYIEGTMSSSRTSIGVLIDGSNTSNFFNRIENVQCNHITIGFQLKGTPPKQSTTQTFINCSSFGDIVTYPSIISKGIEILQYNGNGALWLGGNLEDCKYGIYSANGSAMTFSGVRFEANTTDVFLDVYSKGYTFIGCKNLDTKSIYLTNGYGNNNFISCTDINSKAFSLGERTETIYSQGATETPLKLRSTPSQSAPLISMYNSSSTNTFNIDENGNTTVQISLPIKNNAVSVSPLNVLSGYPGSFARNYNGTTGNTAWIKESGTDSSGWKIIQAINYTSTSARPTARTVGYSMFDSTLQKPIWYVANGNWVDAFGGNPATTNNVTGITGTANQIIASASQGEITLSLPQSINTTANPTFGTVTASLTGTASLDLPLTAGSGKPLSGNLYLNTVAGSSRYVVTNATNTGTGNIIFGHASTGWGGSFIAYDHTHATKPGWVTAGISVSSGGKFSVNANGLGDGADNFTVDANGSMVNNGSITSKYVAKTTTYSILATDHIINATSGTFTITLPTAVGVTGLEYIIKNSSSGSITLVTTSSQTIDGAATKTLAQYDKFKVVSDGANWIVL